KVGYAQPNRLWDAGANQLSNLRIFGVQVNQKGWQNPQSQTEHRPGKRLKSRRNRGVVELRVQCQQRGAEKENDRQAQKEKNALEISLTPVSKNHDHPKERQQRPRCQHDQPQIDVEVQVDPCLRQFYAFTGCTTISKCKINLAPPKLL